MCSFNEHYKNYLGIDEKEFTIGKRIFHKVIHNWSYPGYFYYNMIITNYHSERVMSIHPEYAEMFSDKELSNLLSLEDNEAIEFLKSKFPNLSKGAFISRMLRYSVTPEELKRDVTKAAVLFTNEYKSQFYARFKNVSKEIVDYHWQEAIPLFEKKRSFICCSEDEYFSMSNITNVIDNGGNIGVGTNSKYRKQGYGKATVIKAVDWCFDNSIVPIYLVDARNTPSIKLAESLGMTKRSEEVVVCSERLFE